MRLQHNTLSFYIPQRDALWYCHSISFVLSVGAYTIRPKANGGIGKDRLGERLNGIQEVSGSIPLISTKQGITVIIGLVSERKQALSYIPKENRPIETIQAFPPKCVSP